MVGMLLANAWGLPLETLKLAGILVAPFVLFALVLHWLEYVTQTRLARCFGWRSVLWTGWLGTPIHELSHALMCRVFHHRIDEIALFEPDMESGRLGYVRHSFKAGHWYQELGNFFIGVAPLMGGSLVLGLLMWMFYGSAVEQALAITSQQDASVGVLVRAADTVVAVAREILRPANFITPRFWLFVYFVLCVGSHMAPSPSDYRGASRGVMFVGGGVLLFCFLLAAGGTDAQALIAGMLGLLGPLFALLTITVVLVALATAWVWLLTSVLAR